MPAWYQWATPSVTAMRPACVVSVQYFLCDRNFFAFTMDDTMPTISVQTSTIVPPMQKGLSESSDRPLTILESMAQLGYCVQLPFW